jgi:uncharacterized protein YkwD
MPYKRSTSVFVISFLLFFTVAARADFESRVIELVNIERAAQNLPPLTYNEALTDVARLHSQDMGVNDYFNHTSQDGRAFNERILDAGYDYTSCGENIAASYTSPEAVVTAWMNSDGHRANILSPDYCDIGVGYATVAGSDYTHYWTQDFGRRAGVAQCPAPAVVPPVTSSPTAPGVSSPTNLESIGGGGGGCFIVSTNPNSNQITLQNR